VSEAWSCLAQDEAGRHVGLHRIDSGLKFGQLGLNAVLAGVGE
jgi:hypothetical protein